ncbi:MAG: STAS domain-containing protein [Dissulfurispiraceae bacterium]
MISFQVEEPDHVGVLTIEGSVDIQNAEELKSNLIRAFLAVDKIYVNIERLEDIDISCLELLCSAHLTSVELKKTISFCSLIPETFSTKLRDTGFIRQTGCMHDKAKNCLWVSCSA